MAATITLTFSGVGVDDEYFDVTGNGQIITFKPSRYSSKKVAIKEDIATQIKAFYDSFNTDYNYDDQYTIEYDDTTISITHEDNDHFDSYDDGSSTISAAIATTTTTATATLAESYSATASPCFFTSMSLVWTVSGGVTITRLRIQRKEADGSITEVYDNASHNSNTYTANHTREPYLFVRAIAYIQGTARFYYLTPPIELNIVGVYVTPSPFSSNVSIVSNIFNGSTENTYALTEPGATPEYVSTNVFSGIIPGTYYASVKDKYNCVETEEVVIYEPAQNSLSSNDMFVSIKNSHYFADRNLTATDNAGVTNFLSYDNPYFVKAGEFRQVFHTGLRTTDQFKSNYVRNEAKILYLCDENPEVVEDEADLTLVQRTDNIYRDSFLEAYVDEDPTSLTVRIRFYSGDRIYDADGNEIGQHDYDGVLPDFYEVGLPVKILLYDGIITDIYELAGVTYAVTNIGTLNTGKKTVHSIHQELDYEIYEFVIDHELLGGKEYQVEIKSYSNSTTDSYRQYFLSERCKVIDRDTEFLNGRYHVCYFWSDNSDAEIDYTKFGSTNYLKTDQVINPQPIKHLRLIEFASPLQPISSADIETQMLDEKEVKLNAKTKRVFETNFKEMPALYAGSIIKLFDESDYVEIDGVLFTSISPAQIEYKGQYAKVKVNLAMIGGNNESETQNNTIKRFYPVVT